MPTRSDFQFGEIGGFVVISRKFWNKHASRMSQCERDLFIYLIHAATHQPITIRHRGRGELRRAIELKRGEIYTSIRKLQAALTWRSRGVEKTYNYGEIRSAFNRLIDDKRLNTLRIGNGLKITVLNYSKYQDIQAAINEASNKPAKKPTFYTILGQQILDNQRAWFDESNEPSFFSGEIFKKFIKFHPEEADALQSFDEDRVESLLINFCACRKSNAISSQTVANLIRWIKAGAKNDGKPYDEDIVRASIKTYTTKGMGKDHGKSEAYLRGIIRSEQTKRNKHR